VEGQVEHEVPQPTELEPSANCCPERVFKKRCCVEVQEAFSSQ
jgi:hypothetical protein